MLTILPTYDDVMSAMRSAGHHLTRTASLAAAALLLAPTIEAQTKKAEYTLTEGSAPKDPTNTLPLKTTRILRFTTDEGSWMSVSLSPDGATIMFDLLGDVYTMPSSGGKATRILGGNPMDVQPTYSPDGKRIAFISDRSGNDQLWVANADGSDPVRLSNVESGSFNSISFPTWTPDGQYILVGQTLYHISGGVGAKVPFGGGPSSYTPDGRRVYYSGRDQITEYDLTSGRTRTIVSSPRGAMQPVVSPDGKKLAYFTRYDHRTALMVRDLQTGDDKLVRIDVQHDAGERAAGLGSMPQPAWTRDGAAVLTSYGGKIWKVNVANGNAAMIPFTADVEQYLGPLSLFQYPITDTFTVRQIRDAVPSPNVEYLAFTALDKLYITKLSGRTPKRVTSARNTVEHSPSWSPDGKYIVFATWTDEAGGELYRVNADGSGLKKLSPAPAFYARPKYSPDGRRIVFASGPWVPRRNYVDRLTGALDAAPLTIGWIDAEGGEIHEVAEVGDVSEWNEAAPHFGPDKNRIYFPLDSWQSSGLQSVRWDGSDRRAVYTGDPITLSPTGTHGFVTNDQTHRIYIFPTPAIGSAIQLAVRSGKAAVPTQAAIEIGGEFPGWTQDGKHVFFSLGHSFFLYDVAAGEKARTDSLQQAWQRRLAGDTMPVAGADTLPFKAVYEPKRYDIVVNASAQKASGVMAFKGARVITMKGHEVIEKADIVVTDNRITAVGRSGSVKIPAGAKVIDASGKTIIPGYVDVHAHTWPSFDIHKTAVPAYHANLAFGVTTMRDPQANASDVVTYGDRLRAGDLLGPRMYATGQGIFDGEEIKTLQRARAVVSRYAQFWGTQTVKQYMAGNRRQRQLIVTATHELGISPTTEGAGDFKMSITEMLDGYAGHEHAYEIYPLYKDVAILAAASGITYTPTLLVAYGGPQNKYFLISTENAYGNAKLKRFTLQPDLARRTREASWHPEDDFIFKGVSGAAANIVAHGGHVGVGAHHEVQGMGTPWDLILMSTGGMPYHDVLRVGTIFGARSIGLDRDLGSIEVGKLADLIVLDANPLTNIRNILKMKYVMRDGILYDSETLDEVWPQAKKLDQRWWWTWTPPAETPKAK
jgi:Tol biopolymer transport system component/imidazolonepropionase-like amidohydrolase